MKARPPIDHSEHAVHIIANSDLTLKLECTSHLPYIVLLKDDFSFSAREINAAITGAGA